MRRRNSRSDPSTRISGRVTLSGKAEAAAGSLFTAGTDRLKRTTAMAHSQTRSHDYLSQLCSQPGEMAETLVAAPRLPCRCCRCEPTGPAFGRPDDRLREAISLRLHRPRGGDCFVALRAPRNDNIFGSSQTRVALGARVRLCAASLQSKASKSLLSRRTISLLQRSI